MIIELVVENFRSIKTKQVLSLVKSKSTDRDDNAFTPTPAVPGAVPLLNSAAIYGANAAGKSNLILALRAMRSIVANSAKDSQRGDRLAVTPFRLCEEAAEKPTEFEVIFIADGVKYQYGFALTAARVTEEWLYAYPNGKPQRWFIRAFDESKNDYVWHFSSFFSGKKQLWRESTRSNALFLSTAVMLNSEQLKPVYDWFVDSLKVASMSGWSGSHTVKLCLETQGKTDVLKFLKAADLDIQDIKLESETIDCGFFPDDMPGSVKDELLKEMAGKEWVNIKTVHQSAAGNPVMFDLEDESDGTRKLFTLAGPWIDSLQHGKVLFIDELHDSLHPAVVKFLVGLFHDKKTNPNNAQLIFTTHETSILDQHVFRRDQVWFCNKARDQSTELYPLTDFSPRKGMENLEKAYLSGRYGALPLISTLDHIGE